MKDYYVDLEIAKELKENGFPQDCIYKWNKMKNGLYEICIIPDDLEIFHAPISDEILKELPTELWGCMLNIDKTNKGYYVWYLPIHSEYDKRPKHDICPGHAKKKLTNALAKMWLYLKKEGYIK